MSGFPPLYPDIAPINDERIARALRRKSLSRWFGTHARRVAISMWALGGPLGGFWAYQAYPNWYAIIMGSCAGLVAAEWVSLRLMFWQESRFKVKSNSDPWAAKGNNPLPENFFGELTIIFKSHPEWIEEAADWAIQNNGNLCFRHLLELRHRLGLEGANLIQDRPYDSLEGSGGLDIDFYKTQSWEDIANGQLARLINHRQLDTGTQRGLGPPAINRL